MVQQIARMSIGQTSKVVAVIYALLGLLYIPFGFVIEATSSPEEQIGMGFWIFLALIIGPFGYVGTAVACAIYNGVAKRVGGIEFTLDSKEDIGVQP